MIGLFYEVDQILSRRKIKNKYEYLIKWKGYSINESTWEPEEALFTIRDLIEEYDIYCDKKVKKSKRKYKNLKNEKSDNKLNKMIDIKEEEKKDERENNKPYFLLDNSINKILGIKLEKNKLIGIVERRDEEGKVYTEKISTEDIRKTNPWILVDFYESKITFS